MGEELIERERVVGLSESAQVGRRRCKEGGTTVSCACKRGGHASSRIGSLTRPRLRSPPLPVCRR